MSENSERIHQRRRRRRLPSNIDQRLINIVTSVDLRGFNVVSTTVSPQTYPSNQARHVARSRATTPAQQRRLNEQRARARRAREANQPSPTTR